MRNYLKKNWILFTYLFILLISFSVLIIALNKPIAYQRNLGNIEDFSKGWMNEKNEEVLIEQLNREKIYQVGQIYSLKKQLPSNLSKDCIITFRSYYLSLNVFIDGRNVYSYGYDDKLPFGSSPGSSFHSIDIYREDAGKEIEIRFNTHFNASYERFASFEIGEGEAIFEENLLNKSFGLISCILLFLLGIIYIVIDIPFSRLNDHHHGMMFLGFFSIVFSIWSLIETHILDYFTNCPQVITLFDFLLLTLLPIPILLFVGDNFQILKKNVFKAIVILSIINYFLNLFLSFGHIMDYNQTVIFTQIIMIITMVYISIVFIINLIRDKTDLKRKLAVVTGIGILTIGVLVDLFLSKAHYGIDNSQFTRIGLILFVGLFGGLNIIDGIKHMKSLYKFQLISQLAYIDGLTSIGNRTAFNEKIANCESQKMDGTEIVVIVADVNDLKKVNDQYGHNEGDKVI